MRAVLLALLLTVLISVPAFAIDKNAMLTALVNDEAPTYRQVIADSNQQTLQTLHQQFGDAAFAKMQAEGLDKQLLTNDQDLANILQGVRTIYEKTFNDSELSALYACSSNPDYAPVKAKMPQLAIETQRFISLMVEQKVTKVMPLIQQFAMQNADLFQKPGQPQP